MNDNTIDNDVTMGGGASGTLLAGRYRVVKQLGQGGMGSVWLAEDLKLDGHKVAVKMLPSILVSNKRAYNQLKSEALVALKLTHPNIATVRAFEENEGNPFLVMDYIDGLTLDEYLAKKGKLSEETTYCLLEPVARALDYAHERGIVHRDVKPGNVMVTWDGDPFVLDFGIAREIQETMTRVTGKLSSGTLIYMSPEQLKGASPKPAQDVYSFAALAYECLKGEPPFCRGQVEWQILNDPPEPLPAGIAMAPRVMAGLAKKPEDRPPACLAIMRGGWKSSDAGKTHEAKPKVEAEKTTTSAPRTEAPKAVAPATEAESPLVAQIRERWKLLALVGVSLLTVIALVSSRSTASSPSGRSASAGAVEAGDESKPEEKPTGIDAKYVDVGVLVGRAERLNRADGFAAKIDALVDVQNRARSHYELQKWSQAAKLFDEAEAAAKELIELDRARTQAKTAVGKMERQAHAAKDVGADRYAADRFNVAKDLIVQAKAAFDEMRFSEAADKHELAARQFELSIGEAKAEAVRQKNWRQKGKPFTITDSDLALTMKWCPAGSFDMGSPESEEGRKECEKQHRVTLAKGFWMGETEVTQGQWKKLMDGETIIDLARKALADDIPVKANGTWQFVRDYLGVGNIEDPQDICGDIDDDVPVYYVNWDEAMTFCRRLTEIERVAGRVPDGYEYRLPTEAEWEYACRATTTTALPNGQPFHAMGFNNASVLDDIAWYGGNSSVGFVGRGWNTEGWKEKQYSGGRAAPRKVKGKRPNKWGLFDMTGNVSEWCADITADYHDEETDPLGALKGFVRSFRGGAWWAAAVYSRSAARCWFAANYRQQSLGLRVALAPQYADYPYEAQSLTGQDLTSAVAAARQYHDSLQNSRKQAEEQKKQKQEREKARTEAESARRLAETAEAIRYANAEWNEAQASFDKAGSASDEDAASEYGTAEGLFRRAKEVAEQNAKPTVYLTASLNGESKNAEIVEGVDGQGYRTPILINITGSLGVTHGFAVKYEAFGRTYRGRAYCTSRKGRQTLDVPLRLVQEEGQTEQRAGASGNIGGRDNLDRLLIDMGGGASNRPKFCRHCGTKLADYSNVGSTCPSCNGNLLGE